jgi:cell division protein FtsI/penicillin-binding protein 2
MRPWGSKPNCSQERYPSSEKNCKKRRKKKFCIKKESHKQKCKQTKQDSTGNFKPASEPSSSSCSQYDRDKKNIKDIPGFYFDPDKKRFFKILQNTKPLLKAEIGFKTKSLLENRTTLYRELFHRVLLFSLFNYSLL